MNEPLKLPKRDRGKYEYIRCTKCNRLVYEDCNLTGKKVKTCKFLHRHKFLLRYYVPNSGSKYIVRQFKTRDYGEFQKQAKEFIESLQGATFEDNPNEEQTTNHVAEEKSKNTQTEQSQAINKKPIYDLTFRSLLARYIDFLYGVNIPAHKHRNKDDKTIKGYIKSIKLFKDALKEKSIDISSKLITDIGDHEVGYFHEYLVDSVKENGEPLYAPRTYNNKMADNRAFFKFVKEELGIQITNPFEGVNKKYVRTTNRIIELDEFQDLLKVINKRNGVYEMSDRNKIYLRNHYRTWLKSAYQLALETGERRDGIVLMKWSFIDMDERIITIPNYKVNKIRQSEKERLIPITLGLYKLIMKLGFKKLKETDQYIICPEHENRTTVKSWISKSFTHYWKLTGNDPDISFKHLRKTYVTLMYSVFGDKTKAVTDQNVDTILEFYLNKKKIVAQAKNISLTELDDRRKVA